MTAPARLARTFPVLALAPVLGLGLLGAWRARAGDGRGVSAVPTHAEGGTSAGRGYGLGRWQEPARCPGGAPLLVVDIGAGSLVDVGLDVRCDDELLLTAVRLGREELLERVVRPAGRQAGDVSVESTAAAVRWDPQAAGQPWRAAPVRIEVEAEGCAPWRGTWRPLDGELPWVELEPQG
jgi:hypothetical protein